VSPKKSVEGLYCGIGASLLAVILYKILFFTSMSWASAIFLPILIGVLAQVGDLAESLLKRAYGVKDSGTLLPGHGGILDRFDGIVFTLPIMYTGIQVF
jgi:phosphatidate cytidylyltransferase